MFDRCPYCNRRLAAADRAADATARRGRGRPKIAGPRPWDVAGISRRTWFRRRAMEKAEAWLAGGLDARF